MTVTDARGREIVIRARPVRIVSLAPNLTEILFALGLGDRVVGVTKYCDYPPQAKAKPKVGDVTTSAESVVALKPDLVVGHAFLNSAAVGRLAKLGLTVFAIDPKTISEVIRDTRTLGRITARPKTAESIARKIEQAVASVKRAHGSASGRNVLVVVQSDPLWVAGPKTFVDEMIGLAGARNVAFDARAGFVTFSKELAISRNPDVIVVGLASDVAHFSRSAAWKTTNAVRNKRVCVIPGELLVRPGPRLAEGLRELARRLNY